jgi:hypothetical protein
MIHLKAYVPIITDPTSYYRAAGPLGLLEKQWRELDVEYTAEVSWIKSKHTDIAFVQRPCTMEQLNGVMMLKEQGVPLWIDYDDNYLDVSESNPLKYSDINLALKRGNCVKDCLKFADVVTVTNEALKSKYSEYNKNIQIIPNALDDSLLGIQKEKIEPKNVILWRGNEGQKRDIGMVKDQILEIFEKYKNFHFYFAGYDPCWIIDEMRKIDPKRVRLSSTTELNEWHYKLASVNWSIIIKPLENTTFNHSRSNITWFEACLAGAVCLCPDWSSWVNYSDPNSIVTYEGANDFGLKLENLVENSAKRETLIDRVESGRKWIKEKALLSIQNLKRIEIIKNLLQGANNVSKI